MTKLLLAEMIDLHLRILSETTRDDIEELRRLCIVRGDDDLADICAGALDGDAADMLICGRMIRP